MAALFGKVHISQSYRRQILIRFGIIPRLPQPISAQSILCDRCSAVILKFILFPGPGAVIRSRFAEENRNKAREPAGRRQRISTVP